MKYLDEIPTFPADSARLLESRYGIATAEAFYEHAMHEPQGLLTALGLKKKTDLDHLIKLVEGHIEPAFVRAAKAPVVEHPRGALDPPQSASGSLISPSIAPRPRSANGSPSLSRYSRVH